MNDKTKTKPKVEALEVEIEVEESPETKGTQIILPNEKDTPAPAPQSLQDFQGNGDSLLATIERLATNPQADINKLEKLIQIRDDQMAKEAERQFNEAMSLCQGEIEPVARKAYNEHTKSNYAKLDDICRAIAPIYSKHGFSVTSKTSKSEIGPEWFLTITQIRHVGGHIETIELDLPIDDKGKDGTKNKTGVHGVGSTISYARRYSICMGFNVATGDDNDANGGGDEEYISDEQYDELMDLIENSNTTVEAVCETGRVDELDQIRADRFDAAKGFILNRTPQEKRPA